MMVLVHSRISREGQRYPARAGGPVQLGSSYMTMSLVDISGTSVLLLGA